MDKNKNYKLIKKLVKAAAAKISPQKVILFGSYAYGKPNKDSDVDLLFIKETALSGLKRYCWADSKIEHLLPLDVLIKTPTEVKKRIQIGDPFYKEILRKGKVLYESGN
ncbi:MAG: nucleotidyltransferase domain-containing protein [Candidatus Saganbacteria bacterium]|nr:nucleotidyltransferase domain-containing protein [Candidatus Saganbacteria bacterium]